MNISFTGSISPDAKSDIRALYERHLPWTRELFFLLGIAMLANIFFPDQMATYLFRIPPAQQVPLSTGSKLLFLAIAAIFFWAAFGLPRAWWRWWWPKIEQSCDGSTLFGRVSDTGVRWGSQEQIIAWRRFISVKLSDQAVLLYLTKAYALPIHRSLFASSADWLAFRTLIEGLEIRLYRF